MGTRLIRLHRASFLTAALALLLLCIPAHSQTLKGKVSWIYDGDTLKVEGVGRVRLIGIDTPEKDASERDRYFHQRGIDEKRLRRISREALDFNIANVKGKMVRLEFDGEKSDRYGRTLAYVTLPDGRLLNRLLLEKGLALVYRRFDFRLKEDFIQEEKRAAQRKLGLWNKR